MKVLVTGATGLVGQALIPKLVEKGHQVVAITRNRKKSAQALAKCERIIEHDLDMNPLSSHELQDVTAVIHLAGENIAASRWSDSVKERILSSRKKGTENLMRGLTSQVDVFISASAVGFYGDRADEVLTETSSLGSGFLAEVCDVWEKASQSFPGRRVLLRTGVVLASKGGALAKMKIPFSLGIGGAIGDGKMWMSWIHIDDLVDLFVLALENREMSGVYNAVSPGPVQNADFSKALAAVMRRPLGPSVPAFVLKTAFGEMSSVLLASQKVLPQRLLNQGYHFRYEDITRTLMSLFQKN